MSDIPYFFVPVATSKNVEKVYADFAEWCACPVPPLEERIYSITFVHDGEEWTATVGKTLSGKTLPNPRSRSKKPHHARKLRDPATVLAIFAGVPYFVVTNHRLAGSVGSAWENPFLVGNPKRVIYFPQHSDTDPGERIG